MELQKILEVVSGAWERMDGEDPYANHSSLSLSCVGALWSPPASHAVLDASDLLKNIGDGMRL